MARSKKRLQAKSRSAKAGKGKAKKAALKKKPARAVAKKAKPAKKVAKKVAARKGPSKLVSAINRANARAEVEGLLARLPPPVAPIVKTLRKLVLEVAPEAVERVEGNAPAYFAGGMFARIEPHERDVLVKFVFGKELPSSAVLKSDGSVTLSSLDSVRESVLRTLVREAVMLNLGKTGERANA